MAARLMGWSERGIIFGLMVEPLNVHVLTYVYK